MLNLVHSIEPVSKKLVLELLAVLDIFFSLLWASWGSTYSHYWSKIMIRPILLSGNLLNDVNFSQTRSCSDIIYFSVWHVSVRLCSFIYARTSFSALLNQWTLWPNDLNYVWFAPFEYKIHSFFLNCNANGYFNALNSRK